MRLTLLAVMVAAVIAGCSDSGPATAQAPSATTVSFPPPTTCDRLGGGETPDLVVVSDLPRKSGSLHGEIGQMEQAIRLIFEQHAWRAGSKTVGLMACDDTTYSAGKWDSAICFFNPKAYGLADPVVAVIGPFTSGCAALEIPMLNEPPYGPLLILSPANTYVCLTRHAAACERNEPRKYYPTHKRTYARLAGNDLAQGAALAQFAQAHGLRRVYVLNDREAYGLGMAWYFRSAARSLGINVLGMSRWDGRSDRGYRPLMRAIKRLRPDAVLFAGLIDENGGRLIRDKVAVLGPNRGRVKLLAPDGFFAGATIREGRAAASGMIVSQAGTPRPFLSSEARAFADELGARPLGRFTIEGAQAAEMVLRAIEESDGTRAGVIDSILGMKVAAGLLGEFEIDARGDATNTRIGFYRAEDKLRPFAVLAPPIELVDAAAG